MGPPLSRAFNHHSGVRILPILAVLASCSVALDACSSEEAPAVEASECERGCPTASEQELMSPTVSFTEDVFPIFEKNCSDMLCHGSDEAPRADLYLGPAEDATSGDLDEVYANLHRASTTAPSVRVISVGDPERSFLMNKVDGCQNSLGLTCDAEPNLCRADCGDPMPPLPRDTYSPLAEMEKLTLRRWIAQGARR